MVAVQRLENAQIGEYIANRLRQLAQVAVDGAGQGLLSAAGSQQ